MLATAITARFKVSQFFSDFSLTFFGFCMRRHRLNTALLLAPWLATFGVFWAYPLVQALAMSFTEYQTLTNTARFVGFRNYADLVSDDSFWTALANTSVFAFVTTPCTLVLATALAVALSGNGLMKSGGAARLSEQLLSEQWQERVRSFLRAAYFLPSVTSLVVLSLIFLNLYAANGYVNALLKMLGLPYPQRGWLQQPDTALLAVMAMDVWITTGYYMVLLLAALQTIPRDLYEAAQLAGASSWQQFRRITLPMLRPSLLFVTVISTIKSFQVFVEIYVMTKGGPLDATTTMIYLVYVNAFEKPDMMGYACAVAYLTFAIILSFSMVQMHLLSERNSG
jgi:multiple sugar transport system permease protein